MTAPIAVRDIAAAAGLLLVLGTAVSVVGTVIVPRKSGSRLTRLVASAVNGIFGLIARPVASYQSPRPLTPSRLSGPARVGGQRSRCPRYAPCPAYRFPSASCLAGRRGHPVVQGRSFSGLRTAQMRL